jgi:putative FmdB family regulatory protein
MPTYEYRCDRCEHEFEQFQSITAPPLEKCPACGKRALRRLLGTGGGIIFKGSGFYQTDYRSESYKSAAAAEKKGAGAADGTKSDSPATGGSRDSGAGSKSTPADSKPTRPEKPPKKRATA